MSKKLAIKGHPTRGKEVIELLEMLGGINDQGYIGTNTWKDVYYYLDNGHIRAYDWCDAIKFTLEGFWEKYPFKVGDKVIDEADGCPGVVCEMKWDEDVSDMKYCVAFGNGIDFGQFANDSINFFKIKKNENLEETQSNQDIDKAEFIIKHMILPNKMNDKLEYKIPDGLEFDVVVDGKIILKPIKSKYPTNYQECCDVLGLPTQNALKYINKDCNKHDYYNDLQSTLNCFVSLKMCRDAYWKIAGEEMGLDKPWKPDWKYINRKFYCIYNSKNNIVKNVIYSENKILAFPTEEMRDAFCDNFKDLIEQCKELL